MNRPMRVLFVSGSRASATLRYRVRLPEEALRASGVETTAVHFQSGRLKALAAEADVVTVYRAAMSPRLIGLLEFCADRGIPTTFDVDDRVFFAHHVQDVAFYSGLSPIAKKHFAAGVPQVGLVVPAVQRVSASTLPLVDELTASRSDAVPHAVLPNGIGRATARYSDEAPRSHPDDGTVRIGYFSGSATHDEDWAIAEPALFRILEENPRTELWVVGQVQLADRWNHFGPRVVRIGQVPWTDLPDVLRAVDINLAPLEESPFTEAKSAIKWLEAALVRTPTVATATQPFREAVTEGAGRLVPHGGDWYAPIMELVSDPALRAAIGDEARATAYRQFGPERQVERYGSFYRAARHDPVDRDAVHAALDLAREYGELSKERYYKLEKYPFTDELADRTFAPVRAAAPRPSRGRRVVRSLAARLP
jgi:glycosyltransferase involved in cell wall biosynthesis